MSELNIYLKEINDVKNFVNTVMLVAYDVDLVSGRYSVDAKSLLGVLSLDLSNPVKLVAQTEDPEKLFEDLKKLGVVAE